VRSDPAVIEAYLGATVDGADEPAADDTPEPAGERGA
jgi:hypothetical protein